MTPAELGTLAVVFNVLEEMGIPPLAAGVMAIVLVFILFGVIPWASTCYANRHSPTKGRLDEFDGRLGTVETGLGDVKKDLAENTDTLRKHAHKDDKIAIGVDFLLRTSGDKGVALADSLQLSKQEQ